ncbi:MAG: DinB family protein [Planctomycetota bacterium]
MSNATTESTLRDELIAQGLATMDLARDVTLKYLDGITDENLTVRPCQGGQHALHIMGHLAFAETMLLSMIAPDQAQLADGFAEAFGMGAVTKDDASDYPPVAAIRQEFTAMREKTREAFQTCDEATLLKPLEGEMAQFGRNVAHLAQTLSWHEAIHAGQLTQIRRKLGLPILF